MTKRVLSPARAWWKAFYRQRRIHRREAFKAATDCAIFGNGILVSGPDVPDYVERVDPSRVWFDAKGELHINP